MELTINELMINYLKRRAALDNCETAKLILDCIEDKIIPIQNEPTSDHVSNDEIKRILTDQNYRLDELNGYNEYNRNSGNWSDEVKHTPNNIRVGISELIIRL